MILWREERRRRFDQDVKQAKTSALEASLVVERAQQAQLRRLRQKQLRPPHLGRARNVSHPGDHDSGKPPFFRAARRECRIHRG